MVRVKVCGVSLRRVNVKFRAVRFGSGNVGLGKVRFWLSRVGLRFGWAI